MRDHAAIFAALAEPTRLRILAVLHRLGELCACDLEAGLAITQSRASRHLTALRQAGLLADRRVGAFVYYRLAEPLPPVAAAAVPALVRASARDVELRADLVRTRALRRSPCC